MATKHENQAWAVTIDRPYYPSVEYFYSEAEAQTYAESLMLNESASGGAHEACVCVALIRSAHKIRTDY